MLKYKKSNISQFGIVNIHAKAFQNNTRLLKKIRVKFSLHSLTSQQMRFDIHTFRNSFCFP